MKGRNDPWSVGAWMSTNPASVKSDTLARDAFFTMRKQGYRHLLVVEGGRLLGVVTDRDLRRPDVEGEAGGWNDAYRLDEDYLVRDVMSAAPVTARPRDPLEAALKLLLAGKLGALRCWTRTARRSGSSPRPTCCAPSTPRWRTWATCCARGRRWAAKRRSSRRRP